MTSGSSTMSRRPHPRVQRRVRILKHDLHVAPRFAHAAACEKRSTSSPLKRTDPEVGSISRSRQRPVVVLPLPDSPTRPNVSPASTAKLTSSTALTDGAAPSRPPPRSEVLHEVRHFNECHRRRRDAGC